MKQTMSTAIADRTPATMAAILISDFFLLFRAFPKDVLVEVVVDKDDVTSRKGN